MGKKFLKRYFIGLGVFLLIAATIVIVFDPFYHYHGPMGSLKKVLEERDYEVAGTLDHFDYSSVILGTSIAENYNTDQFLENFGCPTVKAIRAGGSNADLIEYLDRALKSHKLEKVFYFYDYSLFEASLRTTFDDSDTAFITNRNPFDDTKYLWNKDVLLKKISLQLAYSYLFPYDEGEAYSWYQEKTFSTREITGRYQPVGYFREMKSVEEIDQIFYDNATLLEERITANPETDFYLVFSPTSILWWDNEYREGKLVQDLYKVYYLVETLEKYENVKLYYYQNDESVILNLDNYMDTVHFSEQINRMICDRIAGGEGRISSANAEQELSAMYQLTARFSQYEILQYYPDAVTE